MATLTTTPFQSSDSPALLPVGRTDEPASGWFVVGTWLRSMAPAVLIAATRAEVSVWGGISGARTFHGSRPELA